tara:strand:+ start:1000 stop:1500 length:501 start_codon:yes stop_codon:yes gene_type:complete
MSFNQHIGETNNPLAKKNRFDLVNERLIGEWFKMTFGKDPEKDRSYFKDWVKRMRVAYNEEGEDAFPWQADNKSIRNWKKITGRRQVRLNTKDEATIKGPEPDKRSPAAYQKEADRLVNRVRYKKWGDKEIYELRANGKQYRSDDPGDVVDQAMQDAGWPPMRGGR